MTRNLVVRTLVALTTTLTALASPSGAQHRSFPPAHVDSFDPSLLDALGRIEAAAPAFVPARDCAPPDDSPALIRRRPRIEAVQLNSEDNDAVHYARGSTLYFNVFINHDNGSWSDAERDTAAAKATRSANFYMATAPDAANLSFSNFNTTNYYYFITTVNYAIDTMRTSTVEDVLSNFGFSDDDGDGSTQDEFGLYWQNQLGGWDNVVVVYQPADITGRANASFGFSRIFHYIDDNSTVWRHELGHLFGSCDEYSEAGFCNGMGIDCGLCQGTYLPLTANNGNCEKVACPGVKVPCVMNNNVAAVCAFTNIHWGWNDQDTDGLLDFTNRQTTVGNFEQIREMFHNGFFYAASTSAGYVAAQRWESWAVFGLRSPAGTDYDLTMYLDNNHNYQVATSTANAPAVDFVVGDYNHNNLGNEHLIANLVSGPAANYNMTFESGTGTLYPDGQSSGSQTWNDYNVVRVYEVPLFAGETITFTLDILTGALDMGMALYRSNNGPYYAPRSAAVASDDNGAVGVTESFSYTVPSDDVYGLVVWSNSTVDGTFDIQIGPAPATLLEDVSFLSGVDLRLYDFDPLAGYWGVVGTRPEVDTNTDLRLFDDSNYVTQRASSSYGLGVVDFIAVDYNHATAAPDYLRVSREVGPGNHRTEWEQGGDIVTGAESFVWEDFDVVEAWDVFLEGTIPYLFRQYHSGSSLDGGIYLMGSDTGTGDYWESRNELRAFSNGQAPAVGGEWFSYSPPIDDWYGFIMLANNGVSATGASVWVGPKLNWSDDVRLTRNDEVIFGTATPATGVWNVAAVRSTGTDATNLTLYGDDAYTASELKASDNNAGAVRFIVGDWNHNPPGTVYPRTQRATGVGAVDVEWEGGSEALTYDANTKLTSDHVWPANDVAEIWDLFLPASSPVAVSLEILSGNLDLGMELFKSSGAEYYAHRGESVAAGGPSVLAYGTGLSADFYGLVVYNRNDASGTFRISIWNPANVSAAGPVIPKSLALTASPNPSRGAIGLRLSLPQEGDCALELYDVQGRLVRTLASGRMAAGEYPLEWDGRDDQGINRGAGVYLARLRKGGEERRVKLVRTE